jgi:hypothetical protein
MSNTIRLILVLLGSIIASNCLAKTTLYYNVNGYTLDNTSTLREFSAIQFTDDTIDKLFKHSDLLPNTTDLIKIDGQGKTLLPGLIDAHGHVLSYGLSLLQVDLNNTLSEQDAVMRAKNFIKNNKQTGWLLGRGWNQELWQNKQFPQASTLDEQFKDIPIWFKRVDGHAGWANSKAMAIAGITKETLSPHGGQIITDEYGNPTGVFIDNAMNLITDKILPLTEQQIAQVLLKAMQTLATQGLTSVHDAGINNSTINAYKLLASQQKMPIRVNGMIDINDKQIKPLLAQGHYRSTDDMLAINSVKISADGALGSRGAALIDDYSDLKNHKGLLLYPPEKLANLVALAMNAGFQVNTHAIGDNANKLILDLYEKNITSAAKKAMRHRIEHAQVLRLTDISRFAQLKVIASMQATHATSDKNMAEKRLGPQRILGAYAWQKLLHAGAIIAGGSDFPIEPANPFYGLHASITRQDRHNSPKAGWYINDAMTLAQALNSFTYAAAYAGHQEKIIGSLEKGKKADFIIVDSDIFNQSPKQLWKTNVLATWVNGTQVFAP